jgi:fatty-acyl-CoA synthase
VPVNLSARGDELAYLLTQSGPAAVFSDPALEEHVEAGALGLLRRGSLRDEVLA